eukprot:249506_1
MSNKRKGTPGGDRPSKRAKTNNFGEKTELQRQQEAYEKFLQEQEAQEHAKAYRQLQNEQMQQSSNNIVEGTPESEDDDDDDNYLPVNNNKQNQIAE